MCNLYRLHSSQAAIRDLFRVNKDSFGNLPDEVSVYPDYVAPVIVQNDAGERDMLPMRWGFPPPPPSKPYVTNVRNVSSKFWTPWLKPGQRCIVPATAFSEWEDIKPKKMIRWFALNEAQPIFVFAGIWRPWTGVRGTKKDPVEGEHQLFSFLTCPPNAVVAPIHPKAMPAILTTPEEVDQWLSAPFEEALKLQRPLPDDGLIMLP